jgi:hypothetical protein
MHKLWPSPALVVDATAYDVSYVLAMINGSGIRDLEHTLIA